MQRRLLVALRSGTLVSTSLQGHGAGALTLGRLQAWTVVAADLLLSSARPPVDLIDEGEGCYVAVAKQVFQEDFLITLGAEVTPARVPSSEGRFFEDWADTIRAVATGKLPTDRPLNSKERAILTYEREQLRHPDAHRARVSELFGLDEVEYLLKVHELIQRRTAYDHDPKLVQSLRDRWRRPSSSGADPSLTPTMPERPAADESQRSSQHKVPDFAAIPAISQTLHEVFAAVGPPPTSSRAETATRSPAAPDREGGS